MEKPVITAKKKPPPTATTTTTTTTTSDDEEGELVHGTVQHRRPEADLRNEHLADGALLLQFDSTKKKQLLQGSTTQAWRSIEKKGFLVTTGGCLISHPLHCFESKHRSQAPAASVLFFKGLTTTNQQLQPQHNEFGWPCHEEYSHLCHLSRCCSPEHVVIEPFWINRKRNFCGILGRCDCGMQPPCVRTYRNKQAAAQVVQEEGLLLYSTPNLASRLRELFPSARAIRILPSTHYLAEDQKRRNRILRLKRARRHDRQSERNSVRKLAKTAAASGGGGGFRQSSSS